MNFSIRIFEWLIHSPVFVDSFVPAGWNFLRQFTTMTWAFAYVKICRLSRRLACKIHLNYFLDADKRMRKVYRTKNIDNFRLWFCGFWSDAEKSLSKQWLMFWLNCQSTIFTFAYEFLPLKTWYCIMTGSWERSCWKFVLIAWKYH